MEKPLSVSYNLFHITFEQKWEESTTTVSGANGDPNQTCDYGAHLYSNYETRGQRLPYTYSLKRSFREGLTVSTVRLMEW